MHRQDHSIFWESTDEGTAVVLRTKLFWCEGNHIGSDALFMGTPVSGWSDEGNQSGPKTVLHSELFGDPKVQIDLVRSDQKRKFRCKDVTSPHLLQLSLGRTDWWQGPVGSITLLRKIVAPIAGENSIKNRFGHQRVGVGVRSAPPKGQGFVHSSIFLSAKWQHTLLQISPARKIIPQSPAIKRNGPFITESLRRIWTAERCLWVVC